MWPLVSEINTPSQFGTELQKAVWLEVDGLDGPLPCAGARFTGHNFHSARGEWQTVNVIVACEPHKVFSWSVGDDPSFPAATWRYELQPEGDGTLLTFTDTITELGKAARDGAGWHECIARLVAHLDGTTTGDPWAAVHPGYQAKFGPEASTIGPPGR